MDPVSIAGLVGPTLKTLYTVTTTLYTFVTSAKKVDETLEHLQGDVRGLTRVLEDIETFLKDIIIAQTRHATLGTDDAWGRIYNAIHDTRRTIEDLQKVLDRLGPPSKITNGYKKAVKQVHLNINSDEISNIRSRVQWHSTVLQMALQTATLNIMCLTNDNLINIVNPKIDSILPLVPRVESLIKQVENLSSQLTDKFDKLPKEFQDPSMTEYSQQLKCTAEAVIVTASTVIESRSTIMGGQEGQKPSSSTLRVLSEDLKKRKIEEWFSRLTVSHVERGPEYDTISELTPDDSISSIGLNKDKRPQQMDQVPDWFRNCPGGIGPLSRENVEKMDEAGMPGSSPGASKSAGTSKNMSTGGKNPIKNVFVEGLVSRIEENYSASEEYVDPDTISEHPVTQYRMDHKVDTSYNEKSAMELLADLGTNPEAKEWIVNDVLLDLAKMKAGQGVRSSSNIVGTLLYLLEIGADINAIDAKSRTPLHYASEVGSTAVVERLVERNADINVKDKDGRSALHIAASMGRTPVVEILSKSGFDIEQKTEEHQRTALALAARAGRVSTVECLLKAGTSIDAQDYKSYTPLLCAIANGHVEMVEILLKAGASVDAQDYKGYTPLHWASAKGHIGVVEMLLKAKASVDAQDHKSYTPLLRAIAYGHVEMVETLLKAKASVDAQDHKDYTPLHRASANGHAEVVEILLKAGALIEARDYEHYTPLYCASAKGHLRVVEILLKAKASVDAQDYEGYTPLHRASANDYVGVVEMLLKAGALIEAQNHKSYTPLHCASAKGHLRVVEALLKAGAVLDARAYGGWTALTLSAHKGHNTTTELLHAAEAHRSKVKRLLHSATYKHPAECPKYGCAFFQRALRRERIW